MTHSDCTICLQWSNNRLGYKTGPRRNSLDEHNSSFKLIPCGNLLYLLPSPRHGPNAFLLRRDNNPLTTSPLSWHTKRQGELIQWRTLRGGKPAEFQWQYHSKSHEFPILSVENTAAFFHEEPTEIPWKSLTLPLMLPVDLYQSQRESTERFSAKPKEFRDVIHRGFRMRSTEIECVIQWISYHSYAFFRY